MVNRVIVDQMMHRASNLGAYSSNSWFAPSPSIADGAPVAAAPYRLHGGRLSWYTGFTGAVTSTNLYSCSAVVLISAPYATVSPCFAFTNVYRLAGNDTEHAVSGDITYEAVYLELENGTRQQLFFNGGSASITFTGGTKSWVWTDENSIALPANTKYRLLIAEKGTVTFGRQFMGTPVVPVADWSTAQGGDIYATSTTSFVTAVAGGVALPTSGVPGSPMNSLPVLAVARGVGPAVLVVGDSITRYHHQYAGYGSVNGEFGVGVGLSSATGGVLPYGGVSVSSSAFDDLSDVNFAVRKAMLAAKGYPFTSIHCEHGRNSVSLATTAAVIAAAQTAYTFLGTLTDSTPKPIIQNTITPTTTANSTQWSTTNPADQTEDSDNTKVVGFNAWVRTLPAPLAHYVEFFNGVSIDGGTTAKWKYTTEEWTLTADTALNATSFSVTGSTAPRPGSQLVVEPDPSVKDYIILTTVTGSGPWTVGVQTISQSSIGYRSGFGHTHLAGAAVRCLWTPDGIHQTEKTVRQVFTPQIEAAKVAGYYV